MSTLELDAFAAWVETLMRQRGYDIDSPRGGGKSRIADEAGVHRAAVTRLLQRQSMPDLETMRRIAPLLGVSVRDMLIRSGRVAPEELPLTSQDLPPAAAGPPSRTSPSGSASPRPAARSSSRWSASSWSPTRPRARFPPRPPPTYRPPPRPAAGPGTDATPRGATRRARYRGRRSGGTGRCVRLAPGVFSCWAFVLTYLCEVGTL